MRINYASIKERGTKLHLFFTDHNWLKQANFNVRLRPKAAVPRNH